jgi:CubicO group peptidase (beta-lactamase class C family)
MLKKLLATFALIPIALLAWGAFYLSMVLNAASGFSAKNICSGYFLSGMPGQLTIEQELVPASPVLAHVSFEIDTANRLVDTRIFGLSQRRAVFTPGTGCTLLGKGRETLDRLLDVTESGAPDPSLPWPGGSAPAPENDALAPLLDAAFAEPDAHFARNTKAVVVIHKGQLLAERYATGVDAQTPLPGWSMTKSVINLLIGVLVREGKLSVMQTAPVPLWHEDMSDPRGDITVDELLRMSSGLEFNEDYSLYSDVTRMLSVETDAAGFAASKPLVAEPGARWSYSSGTTNILAWVIRQTVGGYLQEYYDFTQQGLFQPLGIHTATIETDNNGTFIGSSFMFASARDWARLGQLCLQDGVWEGKRILPEGWIRYSTTPTPNNPLHDYGAHFWLNADPEDHRVQRTWPTLPQDAYSMNGFQGQRVIIVPSADLVVVRLGFSGGPDRGIEPLVAGLIRVLGAVRNDVPADSVQD